MSEFQPGVPWHGRAVAVTVNPMNDDQALLASESGGVFKTADHGATWRHIDTLPMFRMRDVQYGGLMTGGGLLGIATGWPDSRTANHDLWRSTDGGETWTAPGKNYPPCTGQEGAYGIAFDFAFGASNVFVGCDCGILVSRDYGASWSLIDPNPTGDKRIYGVATRPGSDIVDVVGPAGHHRSRDRGASFGPLTPGFPAAPEAVVKGVHCIAESPVDSRVVFVAADCVSNSPPGIYSCGLYEGHVEGGIFWTLDSSTIPCPASARDPWVSTRRTPGGGPQDFDLYFSPGNGVWRQTVVAGAVLDSAWAALSIAHADHNGIAFSSADCAEFIVSDGGVHVGFPGDCDPYYPIAGPDLNGYHALQLYQVTGQMMAFNTDLYLGTQDNSLWASDSGGSSWNYPPVLWRGRFNEGFHIQVPRYGSIHSPFSDEFEWGTYVLAVDSPNRTGPPYFEHVGFGGSFLNPDHEWSNPAGPIIDNPTLITRNAFGSPRVYVQCLTNSGLIKLQVTSNSGATWSDVVVMPVNRASWPEVSIVGSDVTLYQAYQMPGKLPGGDPVLGLMRIRGLKTDGSVSAPKVSAASGITSGLGSLGSFGMGEGSFINATVFGVDPNDPSHLLAPDISDGKMKVSWDGGASWLVDTRLTDLITAYDPITTQREFRFNVTPNECPYGVIVPGTRLQAHVIAFDPYHKKQILVGTEAAGLFRSTDGGTNWTAIAGSRKVAPVSSIFFVDEFRNGNPQPEALVATYGRGLWKITLPPVNVAPPFGGPPDWGLCWVRWPTGGCAPLSRFFDTNVCSNCVFYAVLDGRITDLIEGAQGVLEAVVIDGGRIAGSTEDGQAVAPSVAVLTSQNNGTFSNCVECVNLVNQGGSVRGVVLQGGQVIGIIGGFGQMPDENMLRQFDPPPGQMASLPDLTAPMEPYLRVEGTFPVGGQATVFKGDSISVIGSGFCGAANCGPLTLSVGSRIISANVPVNANGGFQISFPLTEDHGVYFVTAQQQGVNGILSDTKQVVVAMGEAEEEEEPAAQPQLTIRRNGQQAVIAWPVSVTGFVLESKGNLAAGGWQLYQGQINSNNREHFVNVQPGNASAFFRLRLQ